MHHFPGLFPNPSWATRSLKTAPFGTVQTFLVHTVSNKQTRQWHHIGWHWLHKHQIRFRSVSQQNGCFLAYFTQNRSSYSRAGASFGIHNSLKTSLVTILIFKYDTSQVLWKSAYVSCLLGVLLMQKVPQSPKELPEIAHRFKNA